MTVTNPPYQPATLSAKPTPEALATAVRQHGALGSRLIAEFWRRQGASPPIVELAIIEAIPGLRTTSVRDVALARREPAPFPPDVSGGPLDDLFSSPDAMAAGREALQRSAFEARTFGQCLGAEIVTHGASGFGIIEGAITQFAARHVDELMRMGDSASEAVGDLPRILAGDPETLAERQRAVILRLLSPREGERFHGMGPETRTALALAVLADDRVANDQAAGSLATSIAELVAAATPYAKRLSDAGDVSAHRVSGQSSGNGSAGEVGPEVDPESDSETRGHSI
jgi:hypothetical protein